MADSYLQKAPQGLLEMFDLKTQGKQPELFGDRVQPTVDVTEFYSLDRIFSANTPLADNQFPISGSITASYIRRWFAVSFQVQPGAAPGTYLRMRIGLLCPAPSNPVITLVDVLHDTPITGQFFSATFQFPRPLILPAGAQFSFLAYSDATGTDHVASAQSLTDNLGAVT